MGGALLSKFGIWLVDYDAVCEKIDGELTKQDTHAGAAAPRGREIHDQRDK
jgi:hypothetical protein